MKNRINRLIIFALALFSFCSIQLHAQINDFISIAASTNASAAPMVADNNSRTGWSLSETDIKHDQYLMLTLQHPGNVNKLQLETSRLSKQELQKLLSIFITYDPMNPGTAVI